MSAYAPKRTLASVLFEAILSRWLNFCYEGKSRHHRLNSAFLRLILSQCERANM